MILTPMTQPCHRPPPMRSHWHRICAREVLKCMTCSRRHENDIVCVSDINALLYRRRAMQAMSSPSISIALMPFDIGFLLLRDALMKPIGLGHRRRMLAGVAIATMTELPARRKCLGSQPYESECAAAMPPPARFFEHHDANAASSET